MRRLFLDRSDGKRVRHKDPVLKIIPYIMPHRYDAQVFFSDTIKLDHTDQFIKDARKNGLKLTFLHVVIFACVKTLVLHPKANNFVSNRRVYSRNHTAISFAVKKSMDEAGEETIIKLAFDASDTLESVVEKVNEAVHDARTQKKNSVDFLAGILRVLPGFLLRGTVFFLKILDHLRFMPKRLIKASPFHSSIFITDLGSLGIEPVYHHIYDLGTTSMFLAFGIKRKMVNGDKMQKTMNVKITLDERVADGYYFSKTIKTFKRLMENPHEMIENHDKN